MCGPSGSCDPKESETLVKPVDGQCGTCKWALLFDYAPSPSGREDGVRCACEDHIRFLCEQQGYDYDLEEFRQYGYCSYFRLEVLAEETYICPHWQQKQGGAQ